MSAECRDPTLHRLFGFISLLFYDCVANAFSLAIVYLVLFLTETICVITSDGRVITGELVGNDQVQNLILNQAQERVYADDTPVETVELGLYVIRGDNVCMIGEFDPEKWDDSTVIPPLPPIQQQKL